MKVRLLGAIAAILLVCASCDDNTSNIGIIDNGDNLSVSQASYSVLTRSLKVDSVSAQTSTCYLGRVTDPETNSSISSDFMAQFHVFEGYEFPSYSSIIKDQSGRVKVDSVEVRLYFDKFFGDSINAMKISVFELDTANVLQENKKYYSNIDPMKYINPHRTAPLARKVFAVADHTVRDSLRATSTYYRNVRVMLPNDYGRFIMEKYYENPTYFKNSYNLIRHVLPGFYVRTDQGNGTMLYVDVSSMNIYFRYKDSKDSVYTGISRFAATGEVLQNTTISNGNIDGLLPPATTSCTYLKTPAAIFTEVTLPVDDIYKNHETDSVNTAKIVFTRYNSTVNEKYGLGVPQTLLMLPKTKLYSFFENSDVPDGTTSYVASFSSSYNTYTFSNIANLVSYLKKLRNSGALAKGITTAQWEAQNPDWDKVVLIPVKTTLNSSSAIVKVVHDLSLASTRLVGGDTPLSIQVVYSKFDT
jgi:hypothetical protein